MIIRSHSYSDNPTCNRTGRLCNQCEPGHCSAVRRPFVGFVSLVLNNNDSSPSHNRPVIAEVHFSLIELPRPSVERSAQPLTAHCITLQQYSQGAQENNLARQLRLSTRANIVLRSKNSLHHVHLSSVFLLNPHRPKGKRQTRLTQYTGGGLWCGSARLRPLGVSLLRSVSVPGALGAVAGRGRTTGGRRGCSACRCRPRVGHALYQRGATEDEGILREIVQRYRISGGGQSMGVEYPCADPSPHVMESQLDWLMLTPSLHCHQAMAGVVWLWFESVVRHQLQH
ncbi:hypothetical protein INR49_025312 [Caranx melampygus]|nr:hypothetical protein INR49_025312 [Caranx melampygus]